MPCVSIFIRRRNVIYHVMLFIYVIYLCYLSFHAHGIPRHRKTIALSWMFLKWEGFTPLLLKPKNILRNTKFLPDKGAVNYYVKGDGGKFPKKWLHIARGIKNCNKSQFLKNHFFAFFGRKFAFLASISFLKLKSSYIWT